MKAITNARKNSDTPDSHQVQTTPIIKKAPTFEPSITDMVEHHKVIVNNKKITEYKTLVADSYHSIENIANELLALGYEVQQVTPVLSGRIVLLGGK